ncbi:MULTISPECIES: Rrf2 family transcriptional regulator [Bacillus]|uniref:Rrf2 family transcriptional regulator n=1 Tax=Bacillus TaxID=1386 RepID=UPI0011129446|nr:MULTISPECIES: Rrf2 family transcriptional regulator [Bacillus]QCY65059.1 Rrf2 family transcriptional regulator [Bacillus thuringiensis]QCY65072.1 Rrf2 family transcriptional regulator [Bacillus thuringiensis]
MTNSLQIEGDILTRIKGILKDSDAKLSSNARLLYIVFLVSDGRPLTHTELSESTGIITPVTLRKAIRELEKCGLIRVTRLSKGQVYDIL